MKNYFLFLAGLTCLLQSCEQPYKIGDDYVVYSEDKYGKGYYLTCKPGCNYGPKIENIDWLLSNKKYILLCSTETGQASKFYIIKANGNVLTCCNHDSTIGPFNYNEIKDYIKVNHIAGLSKHSFYWYK